MFQIDSTQLSQGLRQNDFGEKYLYSVHRNTFASIASAVLYQQAFKNFFEATDTLFLIVGTDSGLLIKYLADNPPQKGSSYIFIDFPEIIEKTCIDFEPFSESRIYLTDYEHWQDTAKQYDLSDYLFLNNVTIIQSQAVRQNYLPEYKQLWKKVEEELSDLRWRHLAKTGSQIFIQTQIQNLNENQFSVALLQDKLKGKTAVMLAGGPSLDLHLDWVEKNRDKLVVFSVSRIAKRLLETNIVPDFFVAIDPNNVSFDVSKEVLSFSDKSILINQYHLISKVVSQWKGTMFFMGALFPWSTKNQPIFIDAPGPTVTNVALHAAIFMGIKRIILMGVDLCYSPKGYSHASGSIEHAVGPMSSYIGQLVTTNDGSKAETTNALYNAISTLSSQAQYAQTQGCQFINPSPHASRVESIDYIPIDEIELDDPIQSPIELVQDVLPDDIEAAKKAHYEMIQKELEVTKNELKKVIKLTKKGLNYNDKFFANNEPEKNFKYKLKMDRLEKQLDKKFGALTQVCKSFGIRSFVRFFKPAYDKNMDANEVKEWGETYYEAYQSGASELLKVLNTALKRSEIRLLELAQDSVSDDDAKQLIESWGNEYAMGRAEIFKDNHPKACQSLSDSSQKAIDHLIDIYHKTITAPFEKSEKYLRVKLLADLNGGEAKAYDFFVREDLDGLNRLISSLGEHPDERAIPMKFLAEGYYNELQGDDEKAIEAYQMADKGLALEAALKQLALIAFKNKNIEFAEQALYYLSQLSPAYLPQLADLIKIKGRAKEALDIYADYLEQFPEDIINMLKLASMFQELEQLDGAKFVYEHVLSIDPDNVTAKLYLEQLTQQ